MSNNAEYAEPQEAKAWAYSLALRLYRALLPHSVRQSLETFLFQISPDVPTSLTTAWQGASLSTVFWTAAIVTFVFCFVVVLVWSAMMHTLTGDDPTRIYFSQDLMNIVNFAFICPMYVGFGAVLIAATVQGWARLKELTDSSTPSSQPLKKPLVVLIAMIIVFTVAFLGNAQFMAENMDPTIYPRTYWWMDGVRLDGSRIIGVFGFYYGLINFCLLLVILVVAAAFVSEFRLLFQVATALPGLYDSRPMSTEILREELTAFTQVYLAGKLVSGALMVNMLMWKASQSRPSTNAYVVGIALTFFGVIFLSIPRYYVELQWFRLRAARESAGETSVEYEDLRPWTVKFVNGSWKPSLIANILDTLIIGGFITSYWLN